MTAYLLPETNTSEFNVCKQISHVSYLNAQCFPLQSPYLVICILYILYNYNFNSISISIDIQMIWGSRIIHFSPHVTYISASHVTHCRKSGLFLSVFLTLRCHQLHGWKPCCSLIFPEILELRDFHCHRFSTEKRVNIPWISPRHIRHITILVRPKTLTVIEMRWTTPVTKVNIISLEWGSCSSSYTSSTWL